MMLNDDNGGGRGALKVSIDHTENFGERSQQTRVHYNSDSMADSAGRFAGGDGYEGYQGSYA